MRFVFDMYPLKIGFYEWRFGLYFKKCRVEKCRASSEEIEGRWFKYRIVRSRTKSRLSFSKWISMSLIIKEDQNNIAFYALGYGKSETYCFKWGETVLKKYNVPMVVVVLCIACSNSIEIPDEFWQRIESIKKTSFRHHNRGYVDCDQIYS